MSTPAKKPVPAAPALPFQVGEIETEGRRSRGTASIEFDTSDRRGRSIGTNEFDVSGGRKRTNASVVEQTEAGATRGRSTVTADPVWANHQAKSQREREPSVIDPDVIKMGWIQRYSKPKLTSLLANPWKQQWFVLGLGRLAYFARPGENECLGVIDLDGYHVEVLDDPTILRQVKRDRRQVCLFRLTHPKKREYIFCAENEPDLEEWVECILLEVFREKVSAMSAPPSKDQKPKPVSAEKIAKREISLRRMSREAGLVIAPLAPGTPVAAAKSGDSSIQTVTDDNFDWDAQINAVNTSRSTRGTREAVADETGAGRAARGRSAVVADDFEAGRVQRGRSQHVNEADVMPEGRSTRGRTAVMDGSAPGPQSQTQAQPQAVTTTTSPPAKPAESTPAPAKTPTTSAVAAHKEKPALERANSKVQCDVFEPHMWKKTTCMHCGRAEGEHTGGRKQASKSTSAPAQVATGATGSLVQKHREELERKEKEYRSQREQQTKNMMLAIHEKEERMAKRRAEREQRERDAAEKRKKFEEDMQKQKEKEEAAKRIADQAERAKREQELAAARQAREAQRKKEEDEEKAREEVRLKQVAEEKAKKQKEREERRKQRQEQREKKRKAAEAASATVTAPTPTTGAPTSVKAEAKDQPATKPALKVNTEAKEAPQVLVAEDSEYITVPSAAAPEVKALVQQLLDLQKNFGALSEDQCAQKGSQSYAELKNFVPKIQQLREAHGDDVNVAVKLYNRLNKSIPKRVNEVLQKVQEQRLKAAAAAAETKATNDGTCQVCRKPLTGSTVEALGGFFHVECFKCTSCLRPFVKTCLNIEGKPYCDGCGRRAFVQAKLRNKAKAEGNRQL